MVFETLPRCRLKPLRHSAWLHSQHGGSCQGWQQCRAYRNVVIHQPDAIQTLLFPAQRFAQLALEVQVLFAARIACSAGNAQQQPLVLQGCEFAGLAIQRLRGQRWQGTLGTDQLAKVASSLRPDHVVHEVRSHDRAGAHQQHKNHFPATRGGIGRTHLGRVDGWHGVDGHAQRLILDCGCRRQGGSVGGIFCHGSWSQLIATLGAQGITKRKKYLIPDIQNNHKRAQAKPLEGIAIVLVDSQIGSRPFTQQPLTGRAGLQQGCLFEQRQTGFCTESRHVKILPYWPRIGTLEFIKLGGWRGNPALNRDHACGSDHGWQTGTIDEVTRSPSALYQNRLTGAFKDQWRHDPETTPTIHRSVVKVNRVRRLPDALKNSLAVNLISYIFSS